MKLGDKVIVIIQPRPYEKERASIGKIVGETKTSWRVEYGDNLGNPKDLFLKTDLRLRGADSFSCTKIKPWSDEEWRKYQRALLRKVVIRNLQNFEWDKLSTDYLVKVHNDACREKRAKVI